MLKYFWIWFRIKGIFRKFFFYVLGEILQVWKSFKKISIETLWSDIGYLQNKKINLVAVEYCIPRGQTNEWKVLVTILPRSLAALVPEFLRLPEHLTGRQTLFLIVTGPLKGIMPWLELFPNINCNNNVIGTHFNSALFTLQMLWRLSCLYFRETGGARLRTSSCKSMYSTVHLYTIIWAVQYSTAYLYTIIWAAPGTFQVWIKQLLQRAAAAQASSRSR